MVALSVFGKAAARPVYSRVGVKPEEERKELVQLAHK